MADIKFSLQWIPGSYAAQIQRSAVLAPLAGRCRSAADIERAVQVVQRKWRARTLALRNEGFGPLQSKLKLATARNCHPAFAHAEPVTHACGLEQLCPFCYARRIIDVWRACDRVFEASGEMQWLTRRRSVVLPYDDDVEAQAAAIYSRLASSRQATMRRMKTCGAYAVTTLVPTIKGWRLSHKELHLLRLPYSVPDKLEGRIVVLGAPSRQALAWAVARLCRYPREHMTGDPSLTRVALDARRGQRMAASFGIFRNRSEHVRE